MTQPFNLSQPKVKALPEPIRIPKIVTSNPIPETTYSTNLNEVLDEKKKRKEEEKEVNNDFQACLKYFIEINQRLPRE